MSTIALAVPLVTAFAYLWCIAPGLLQPLRSAVPPRYFSTGQPVRRRVVHQRP